MNIRNQGKDKVTKFLSCYHKVKFVVTKFSRFQCLKKLNFKKSEKKIWSFAKFKFLEILFLESNS